MEEKVEDIERLLNEYLKKHGKEIGRIYDVKVSQNLNGKGWFGSITYMEKEETEPIKGHSALQKG